MLCGVSVVFNSLGDVLGLVSCKRSSENGQVLVGFQSTKPLAASIMPAAVQRNAIAAFRHRFTLRQTRRTVPIIFSIELVQASERLIMAKISQRPHFNGAALPGKRECTNAAGRRDYSISTE